MDYQEIVRSLEAAQNADDIPVEVIARFLHNVERIAHAQEVIAGIKPKPSLSGFQTNGATHQ